MDSETSAGSSKISATGGEVPAIDKGQPAVSMELVKEFVRTSGDKYAPWVFGVASTLILWTYVVNPEFERRNIDWEGHQKIIESHQQIVQRQQDCVMTQERTSTMLRDTSVVLDKTSERLERMMFATEQKDK